MLCTEVLVLLCSGERKHLSAMVRVFLGTSVWNFAGELDAKHLHVWICLVTAKGMWIDNTGWTAFLVLGPLACGSFVSIVCPNACDSKRENLA